MSGAPGETFAYFLEEDPLTTALPMPTETTDRMAVVRDGETYYATIPNLFGGGVYLYYEPVTGETLSLSAGLGALVLAPAGVLATLAVVLPLSPSDGQVFELSSTQTLTALTVTAPAGATVMAGAASALAANTGRSWRYVAAENTWFVRFV